MSNLIELWHKRARPNPTKDDLVVQVGCHIEEFLEMLDTVDFYVEGSNEETSRNYHSIRMIYELLTILSMGLKSKKISLYIKDREQFLDSLADQIVTAIGCGHCAGMKVAEALLRVNESNWSKFDIEGNPIRDSNGKITKGESYKKPNLEGLY